MTTVFAARLVFDAVAAGLLVFGLSYWWLGDLAHEVAGTALFILLVAHNAFNRRWYGQAARRRPSAAGWFGLVATAVLASAMLVLVVTSVAITTAVPNWLPGGTASAMRQLHVAAAYWAFAAVAVHLGLRWPLVMGVTRRACGIVLPNRCRTATLRLIVVLLAFQGIRSAGALDLGGRLTMRMSLDWWNFDEAVLGFFVHCAAIAGLLVSASYYVTRLLQTSPLMNGAHDRMRQ